MSCQGHCIMHKYPIESIKKSTPKNAKELFKPFLFPCRLNKTPDIRKGQSWEHNNPEKKPIIRSIDTALCGLDCGHARVVVIDIDSYKMDFKNSKPAQKFFSECKKKSSFLYKTPRGGHHIFFKGTIKSCAPFPGVEIKSKGGYICLYNHPATLGKYESWDEFYKDLPIWDFKEWGQIQKQHREFGPGKNNQAVISRASKAGLSASLTKAKNDIKELFSANKNRQNFDIDKHLIDYLNNLQKSWTPLPDQPVAKHKNPSQDKTKQKTDIPILSSNLQDVKPFSISYIDQHKLFLKRVLIALAGPKGSLKSSGVITYLLNEGARIGYFSDNEIMQPMLVNIIKMSKNPDNIHNIHWLYFDRVMEHKKNIWDYLKAEIQKLKLDVVFEDPPYEDSDFATLQGTRHALGLRAKIADELKITWTVTRNFSKTECKNIINKVGGFALWSTIPRTLLMTFSAHKNSEHFKKSKATAIGELKKMALLHSYINNLGKTPSQSVLMNLINQNENLIMDFKTTPRLENPENWGKPIDFKKIQAEKTEAQTRLHKALHILSSRKDKGLSSGDFKMSIMDKCSISVATAQRLITNAKEKGFIKGGGSGPSSNNLKITKSGLELLEGGD